LGSYDSISKITREDLFDYYKKTISPNGARLAIVGDLEKYNVKEILEKELGNWHGQEVPEPVYTEVCMIQAKEIEHHINRDQVVLCFAGLTVKRTDPDYDKLLLFDQIFGGGVLGSMSSRLFDLRERSGLFYTIAGSLISRAEHQPGMVFVKTIVSLDRL